MLTDGDEIQTKIQEIDDNMDLVMVTEYVDESLVLLKVKQQRWPRYRLVVPNPLLKTFNTCGALLIIKISSFVKKMRYRYVIRKVNDVIMKTTLNLTDK